MANQDHYAVMANRLTDGAVLIRISRNHWSPYFAEASVTQDEEVLAGWLKEAEALVAKQIIMKPYSFLVEWDEAAGAWRAQHIREEIRIKGPSVPNHIMAAWRAKLTPLIIDEQEFTQAEEAQDVSL